MIHSESLTLSGRIGFHTHWHFHRLTRTKGCFFCNRYDHMNKSLKIRAITLNNDYHWKGRLRFKRKTYLQWVFGAEILLWCKSKSEIPDAILKETEVWLTKINEFVLLSQYLLKSQLVFSYRYLSRRLLSTSTLLCWLVPFVHRFDLTKDCQVSIALQLSCDVGMTLQSWNFFRCRRV